MTVALYIDPARGPYADLLGADACYGVERDARTFTGPGPVVAHPPCGPWGRMAQFCTLQDPSCGPIATEQVRSLGGVLEHPAQSRLWTECDLPRPTTAEGVLPADSDVGEVWTLEIDQCRFGHPCRKRTWLLFSGVRPSDLPPVPEYREPTHVLRPPTGSGSRYAGRHLPKSQRHLTPIPFAQWLIAAITGA